MENWNNVVKPEDKVYHLGDVGFKNFEYMKRVFDYLNGTKILIKGNHDNLKLSQYAQMFKDVRATHTLDKFVLSHIPIHPDSLARWKANIHGHTHANNLDDPRYINVSVEQLWLIRKFDTMPYGIVKTLIKVSLNECYAYALLVCYALLLLLIF
jgi:calcineurin-like phosphoesterase family protein